MRKNLILSIILSLCALASCSQDKKNEKAGGTAAVTAITATAEETETTATTQAETTASEAAATTAPAVVDIRAQELVEKVTAPDYEAEEKAIISAVNDIIDPAVMFDHNYQFGAGTPNGIAEFYTLENYMIYEAESILDDRYLGAVIDEGDAAEKGRYVYLMCKGQNYIDRLEKEPAPQDGIGFTRDDPPFLADYYEDYDVWRVRRIPASWTRNDGAVHSVSWSEGSSYVLIRGCDGKVLGSYINY